MGRRFLHLTVPSPSLPSGLHFIVSKIGLVARTFVARVKLAAIAVHEITSMNNIIIMHQAVIGRSGPSRSSLRIARNVRCIIAAAWRSVALEALERCARLFAHAFHNALGFGLDANRCTGGASGFAQGSALEIRSRPLAASHALKLNALGNPINYTVLLLSSIDRS